MTFLGIIGGPSDHPEKAAQDFAATFWAEPRKTRDMKTIGKNLDLAVTFGVVNDMAEYEARWSDDDNAYRVYRY